MGIKRGIDKATELVVNELKEMAQDVGSRDEIEQVATISANNDKVIGFEIAGAIDKVGKDGVITIEESKTMETYTTIVEGTQFDRGYISPYFAANFESGIVEYNNPFILLYGKKISVMQSLLPILEMVAEGIIDPVMVTRSAIQNAASISGLLLTTEAVVANMSENNSEPAGGMPMGMPGMM